MFVVVRGEDDDGVRFVKASQVVEVAILTIGIFDIIVHDCHRCATDDRGAIANFGHELFPTVAVFCLHELLTYADYIVILAILDDL
jgi:hypothetical protein